ncbi:MAG TPA: rRNA maturation RNase YbeY [Sedimentisphaerales bacterium]|nr:rRNA maturation RNase YbeY [Phycisphaerae bacterium]HON93357.1 rRNA maturation RNase YbeY [Sedimentisphaerales bacterium]HQI27918.1 rRNA maturation RNase YbeY [Sedimentisphaerales bacterium]
MITVRITKHYRTVSVDTARLRALVKAVCRRFEVREAVVSIGIVNDVEMAEFNMRFLRHEGTTDCMSFDLSDNREEAKLFDLIVNVERAAREAARRGHSVDAELALYVTHGLLHNLGFDDATPAQAGKMHRMEDEILQHQGYGVVYNTDTRAR